MRDCCSCMRYSYNKNLVHNCMDDTDYQVGVCDPFIQVGLAK